MAPPAPPADLSCYNDPSQPTMPEHTYDTAAAASSQHGRSRATAEQHYQDVGARGDRVRAGSSSSESSSSVTDESLLDISRRYPRHKKSGGILRYFFTAPSESHGRHRRRSRKRRGFIVPIFGGGNSSSSSLNSDLAYGDGYIPREYRRASRENLRTRSSRTNMRADPGGGHGYVSHHHHHHHEHDHHGAGPSTVGGGVTAAAAAGAVAGVASTMAAGYATSGSGRRERDSNRPRRGTRQQQTDEEILELGRRLSEIARLENKAHQRAQGRRTPSQVAAAAAKWHEFRRSRRGPDDLDRGIGASRPTGGARHEHEDDSEWESMDEDEESSSDAGYDDGLAYGSAYKLDRPPSRPQWQRPAPPRPAQPYQPHQQTPPRRPERQTTNPYEKPPESIRPPDRKPSAVDPRLFGPVNSLRNFVDTPCGFGKDPYRPPDPSAITYEAPAVDVAAAAPQSQSGSASFEARGGQQPPMHHVWPVSTTDPTVFDARGSSVVGPADSRPAAVARPGPIPIQQPKPKHPVSAQAFEDSLKRDDGRFGRFAAEEGKQTEDDRSSDGSRVLAGALAGTAAVGAAAHVLSQQSKEKEREEERERQRKRTAEYKRAEHDDGRVPGTVEDEKRARGARGEATTRDERPVQVYHVSGKAREKRPEEEAPKTKREETLEERISRLEREIKEKEARREQRRRDEMHRRKRPDVAIIDERNNKSAGDVDVVRRMSDEPRSTAPEVGYEREKRHRRPRDEEKPNPNPFDYLVSNDAFETPRHGSPTGVARPAERPLTPVVIAAEPPPDWDSEETRSRVHSPERSIYDPEYPDHEAHVATAPISPRAFRRAASEVAEEDSRGRSPPRRQDSASGKDPVQEQADRYYREMIKARKYEQERIRSESRSPPPSVVDKFEHDDSAADVPRIVTPPGMEKHAKRGQFDGPNADVRVNHVLLPKDLYRFTAPDPSMLGSDMTDGVPRFSYRDPSCERERPMLNIVMPTPAPSPTPEDQEGCQRTVAAQAPHGHDYDDGVYDKEEQQREEEEEERGRKRHVERTEVITMGPRGEIIRTASPSLRNREPEPSPSEDRGDMTAQEPKKKLGKGWAALRGAIGGGAILAAASEAAAKADEATSKDGAEGKVDEVDDATGQVDEAARETDEAACKTDETVDEAAREMDEAAGKGDEAAVERDEAAGKIDEAAVGIHEAAGRIDEAALETDEAARKIDEAAVETDEAAGKVDEAAVETDEAAGKIDEAAGETDEAAGKIDETSGETDEATGKTDEASTKIDETAGEIEEAAGKVDEAAGSVDDAGKADERSSEPLQADITSMEAVHADSAAELSREGGDLDVEDLPPPPGPKPSSPRTAWMPGSFDIDTELAATTAIALEQAGFPSDLVMNNVEFQRRSSPPGSSKGIDGDQPSAETATDLDLSGVGETASSERRMSPPRDTAKKDGEDDDNWDMPSKSSKKKKSKRNKTQSFDDYEDTAARSLQDDDVSGEAKSAKNVGRRRDRNKPQVVQDIPLSEEPTQVEVVAEEDDDWTTTTTTNKKRGSKRGSRKSTGEGSEKVSVPVDAFADVQEAAEAEPVSVPVDAFADVQQAVEADPADEWEQPKPAGKKKGKKGSKRDSVVVEQQPRSAVSQSEASETTPGKKKQKKNGRQASVDDYGDVKDEPPDKASRRGTFELLEHDVTSVASDPAQGQDSSEKTYRGSEVSEGDDLKSVVSSHAASQTASKKKGKKGKRFTAWDEAEATAGADDTGADSDGKKQYFDKADTLGAGVGFVGAAVATMAAASRPNATQSGSDDGDGPSWSSSSRPRSTSAELVDPEVVMRTIRPAVDPLYRDLLPLPPSVPSSPKMDESHSYAYDPDEQLPALPASRPDTPPEEEHKRLVEELASRRRSRVYETPPKHFSEKAIPVAAMFRRPIGGGSGSNPSSPGVARLSSPAASSPVSGDHPVQDLPPTPRGVTHHRRLSRPTSWDGGHSPLPLSLPLKVVTEQSRRQRSTTYYDGATGSPTWSYSSRDQDQEQDHGHRAVVADPFDSKDVRDLTPSTKSDGSELPATDVIPAAGETSALGKRQGDEDNHTRSEPALSKKKSVTFDIPDTSPIDRSASKKPELFDSEGPTQLPEEGHDEAHSFSEPSIKTTEKVQHQPRDLTTEETIVEEQRPDTKEGMTASHGADAASLDAWESAPAEVAEASLPGKPDEPTAVVPTEEARPATVEEPSAAPKKGYFSSALSTLTSAPMATVGAALSLLGKRRSTASLREGESPTDVSGRADQSTHDTSTEGPATKVGTLTDIEEPSQVVEPDVGSPNPKDGGDEHVPAVSGPAHEAQSEEPTTVAGDESSVVPTASEEPATAAVEAKATDATEAATPSLAEEEVDWEQETGRSKKKGKGGKGKGGKKKGSVSGPSNVPAAVEAEPEAAALGTSGAAVPDEPSMPAEMTTDKELRETAADDFWPVESAPTSKSGKKKKKGKGKGIAMPDVEPEPTTAAAEPELSTSVVAEPESSTAIAEPESSTPVVAEPESSSPVVEPESSIAAIAEPEPVQTHDETVPATVEETILADDIQQPDTAAPVETEPEFLLLTRTKAKKNKRKGKQAAVSQPAEPEPEKAPEPMPEPEQEKEPKPMPEPESSTAAVVEPEPVQTRDEAAPATVEETVSAEDIQQLDTPSPVETEPEVLLLTPTKSKKNKRKGKQSAVSQPTQPEPEPERAPEPMPESESSTAAVAEPDPVQTYNEAAPAAVEEPISAEDIQQLDTAAPVEIEPEFSLMTRTKSKKNKRKGKQVAVSQPTEPELESEKALEPMPEPEQEKEPKPMVEPEQELESAELKVTDRLPEEPAGKEAVEEPLGEPAVTETKAPVDDSEKESTPAEFVFSSKSKKKSKKQQKREAQRRMNMEGESTTVSEAGETDIDKSTKAAADVPPVPLSTQVAAAPEESAAPVPQVSEPLETDQPVPAEKTPVAGEKTDEAFLEPKEAEAAPEVPVAEKPADASAVSGVEEFTTAGEQTAVEESTAKEQSASTRGPEAVEEQAAIEGPAAGEESSPQESTTEILPVTTHIEADGPVAAVLIVDEKVPPVPSADVEGEAEAAASTKSSIDVQDITATESTAPAETEQNEPPSAESVPHNADTGVEVASPPKAAEPQEVKDSVEAMSSAAAVPAIPEDADAEEEYPAIIKQSKKKKKQKQKQSKAIPPDSEPSADATSLLAAGETSVPVEADAPGGAEEPRPSTPVESQSPGGAPVTEPPRETVEDLALDDVPATAVAAGMSKKAKKAAKKAAKKGQKSISLDSEPSTPAEEAVSETLSKEPEPLETEAGPAEPSTKAEPETEAGPTEPPAKAEPETEAGPADLPTKAEPETEVGPAEPPTKAEPEVSQTPRKLSKKAQREAKKKKKSLSMFLDEPDTPADEQGEIAEPSASISEEPGMPATEEARTTPEDTSAGEETRPLTEPAVVPASKDVTEEAPPAEVEQIAEEPETTASKGLEPAIEGGMSGAPLTEEPTVLEGPPREPDAPAAEETWPESPVITKSKKSKKGSKRSSRAASRDVSIGPAAVETGEAAEQPEQMDTSAPITAKEAANISTEGPTGEPETTASKAAEPAVEGGTSGAPLTEEPTVLEGPPREPDVPAAEETWPEFPVIKSKKSKKGSKRSSRAASRDVSIGPAAVEAGEAAEQPEQVETSAPVTTKEAADISTEGPAEASETTASKAAESAVEGMSGAQLTEEPTVPEGHRLEPDAPAAEEAWAEFPVITKSKKSKKGSKRSSRAASRDVSIGPAAVEAGEAAGQPEQVDTSASVTAKEAADISTGGPAEEPETTASKAAEPAVEGIMSGVPLTEEPMIFEGPPREPNVPAAEETWPEFPVTKSKKSKKGSKRSSRAASRDVSIGPAAVETGETAEQPEQVDTSAPVTTKETADISMEGPAEESKTTVSKAAEPAVEEGTSGVPLTEQPTVLEGPVREPDAPAAEETWPEFPVIKSKKSKKGSKRSSRAAFRDVSIGPAAVEAGEAAEQPEQVDMSAPVTTKEAADISTEGPAEASETTVSKAAEPAVEEGMSGASLTEEPTVLEGPPREPDAPAAEETWPEFPVITKSPKSKKGSKRSSRAASRDVSIGPAAVKAGEAAGQPEQVDTSASVTAKEAADISTEGPAEEPETTASKAAEPAVEGGMSGAPLTEEPTILEGPPREPDVPVAEETWPDFPVTKSKKSKKGSKRSSRTASRDVSIGPAAVETGETAEQPEQVDTSAPVTTKEAADMLMEGPAAVTSEEPVTVTTKVSAPVAEQPGTVTAVEPVPTKNEGSITAAIEERPVTEESVPIAEQPAAVTTAEPVPVASEESAAATAEEPAPMASEEPIAVTTEEPAPAVSEESTTVTTKESAAVTEQSTPLAVIAEEADMDKDVAAAQVPEEQQMEPSPSQDESLEKDVAATAAEPTATDKATSIDAPTPAEAPDEAEFLFPIKKKKSKKGKGKASSVSADSEPTSGIATPAKDLASAAAVPTAAAVVAATVTDSAVMDEKDATPPAVPDEDKNANPLLTRGGSKKSGKKKKKGKAFVPWDDDGEKAEQAEMLPGESSQSLASESVGKAPTAGVEVEAARPSEAPGSSKDISLEQSQDVEMPVVDVLPQPKEDIEGYQTRAEVLPQPTDAIEGYQAATEVASDLPPPGSEPAADTSERPSSPQPARDTYKDSWEDEDYSKPVEHAADVDVPPEQEGAPVASADELDVIKAPETAAQPLEKTRYLDVSATDHAVGAEPPKTAVSDASWEHVSNQSMRDVDLEHEVRSLPSTEGAKSDESAAMHSVKAGEGSQDIQRGRDHVSIHGSKPPSVHEGIPAREEDRSVRSLSPDWDTHRDIPDVEYMTGTVVPTPERDQLREPLNPVSIGMAVAAVPAAAEVGAGAPPSALSEKGSKEQLGESREHSSTLSVAEISRAPPEHHEGVHEHLPEVDVTPAQDSSHVTRSAPVEETTAPEKLKTDEVESDREATPMPETEPTARDVAVSYLEGQPLERGLPSAGAQLHGPDRSQRSEARAERAAARDIAASYLEQPHHSDKESGHPTSVRGDDKSRHEDDGKDDDGDDAEVAAVAGALRGGVALLTQKFGGTAKQNKKKKGKGKGKADDSRTSQDSLFDDTTVGETSTRDVEMVDVPGGASSPFRDVKDKGGDEKGTGHGAGLQDMVGEMSRNVTEAAVPKESPVVGSEVLPEGRADKPKRKTSRKSVESPLSSRESHDRDLAFGDDQSGDESAVRLGKKRAEESGDGEQRRSRSPESKKTRASVDKREGSLLSEYVSMLQDHGDHRPSPVRSLPPVQEEEHEDGERDIGHGRHVDKARHAVTPDMNRDSGFITESPHPLRRSNIDADDAQRDSGVHIRDWPESGPTHRREVPRSSPDPSRSTWAHAGSSDSRSTPRQVLGVSPRHEGLHLPRRRSPLSHERSTDQLQLLTPKLRQPSFKDTPPEPQKRARLEHDVGDTDLPRSRHAEPGPKAIGASALLGGVAATAAAAAAASSSSPGQRSVSDSMQASSSRSVDPAPRRSASNTSLLRHKPSTPDLKMRPDSPGINRLAHSGTPPLRRIDKRMSGDLRRQADLVKDGDHQLERSLQNTTPVANESRVRAAPGMTDVFDGYGEGRIGSPRSPTRPHSIVRRRQSMQVLELEMKVEQLLAENRALQEAKSHGDHNLRAASLLAERESEIENLKSTVDFLQKEVARLKEVNEGLNSANEQLALQHSQYNQRYRTLETQHAETSRALETARVSHEDYGRSLQEKDAEIEVLRKELNAAREEIRALQAQILQQTPVGADDFLRILDVDHFDHRCQQLCAHVQQWVLRFSKFSDMRACRLTSEINDEKIIDRLDNAVLDGSDVDDYLRDRVRRRDIFMSMTMNMIWEYVFTRYLFGMDREQRQKLKSLEKQLTEVGPTHAVRNWRAITLTLLSRRPTFQAQRELDTEAVVQAIFQTLSTVLPPPSHLEDQIQLQLRRVLAEAVDLAIEMRTQRAEYMMLPPLQPEYDPNGDLAETVLFNGSLMNERSGAPASGSQPPPTNEELEALGATVRVVLFPLVVKKGDDDGRGEDEIVVCPAQVLVNRPRRHVRMASTPATEPDSEAGGAGIGVGSSPAALRPTGNLPQASRSNVSMHDVVPEAQYIEGCI